MQRLNPLRLLPLAQPVRRRDLEERRRRLYKPLRLNRRDIVHVLLGSLDQGVVDDVLRRFLVQRTGWMHIHWRILREGLVALRLSITARTVLEEACTECFSDLGEIATARGDALPLRPHDLDQLFPYVGHPAQISRLDVVFLAPERLLPI